MINIAICDDDQKQLDLIQGILAQYQQEHSYIDCKVTSFVSSLEMISFVEAHGGFDIYLLDIYMSGISGTQAARQLRQLGDKGEIIFLTSSRDQALEAFAVDACQYITKPYSDHTLFLALDKVFYRLNVERRHFITVKTKEGMLRLYTRNVVFTESGRNNYQIIHLVNKETIEVRMTSAELFELLAPAKFFVRCGVSVNLNLKYVRQITKALIVFDTGEQIPYPYRAYQKLKEAFLSFQLASER